MTLRDYFIAHAPAEPQPWFEPEMPPCPEPVYVSDDGEREYSNYYNASKIEGEFFSQKNNAEAAAWNTERFKQRYVQWPAAWADEMLKARKA
jgi:hypothetical protein